MALEVGSRLGVFEVTGRLGEGGMGVVYRATDTTLHRDVALKVLPDAFATDPERLARFEREAKVLASLNHPNIAQIHGLEQSSDVRALVLELVEGPTLQDRIAKGPIPLDEALPIARQIAEALEAAHEQGIIHRDLKPANVKVKSDGTVKVLDFGLAKALGPELSDTEAANSPTMTMTAAATKMGVIMGTAAYMSPEQARGKQVDKRADVWAFGVVLFEMLTGQQAFGRTDISETLVSVFRDDPDWSALPDETPARIHQTLRVCLQRETKERVRDVSAVRLALDGAFEAPGLLVSQPANADRPWSWQSATRLAVAVIIGAGIATLVGLRLGPPSGPASNRPTRLTITLPSDQRLAGVFPIAISPDGTQLVYAARTSTQPQLYLRPLEQFEARVMPGTEGASMPFFSPDGQWVAFEAENQLKKVSLAGGRPLTVAEGVLSPFGATWGEDGTIIYSPTLSSGLRRVSADGGPVEQLTLPDSAEGVYGHVHPQFLPDGRSVLFTAWGAVARSIVLSLETGGRQDVFAGASSIAYLPTGHIVFTLPDEADQVVARPFDLQGLSAHGAPLGVLYDALWAPHAGRHILATSESGTLAYVPQGDQQGEQLVWVDRAGSAESMDLPRGTYERPELSPDATRVAVGNGRAIQVIDIERGTRTTIPQVGSDSTPRWTPDGHHITFGSNRAGSWDLYTVPADASEAAKPLLVKPLDQFPNTWSPDGRSLIFHENHPTTGWDLWVLPLDGEPSVLLALPSNEMNAEFSPDGRWVAYVSDESGRDEVYVQTFPEGDLKRTVSSDGGSEVRWAADGRALFFRNGDDLFTVEVDAESIGAPVKLFEGRYQIDRFAYQEYDVSPDSQRFLMVTDSSPDEIRIVLNWFSELQTRVPTGR